MGGLLDIRSGLKHFALINYAVPEARLRPHIPERFELPTFDLEGEAQCLMSVVPFVDDGFHYKLLPFVRFHFCQTNFRVYVIDRRTGEDVVWFFGTTLGGWPVYPARWLWKIPWHHGRYAYDCAYDTDAGCYERFTYRLDSPWCQGRIALQDTGEPVPLVSGFESREEMMRVLTHPVHGYFYRLDGRVGTYSVSHDLLDITRGEAVDLYFSLFETLEVLDAEEMQRPHSVFICPETVFDIHMPPKASP